MLYHGENPIIRMVSVEHMKWHGGDLNVAPRPFSCLVFRISGRAVIEAAGETLKVDSGDILYIPQHLAYKAQYTDTEAVVIHFIAAENDTKAEVYSFQSTERLYKLFLQALSYWRGREPGFKVYTVSTVYAILGAVLEKETKTKLPPYFLSAVAILNSEFRDNISVAAVCRRAGISQTAFRRIFKENYRKTPVEYINELRLEYARNLITGGTTIEDAAIKSGFGDPKYFARVVKKYFGCTPRALKSYGK